MARMIFDTLALLFNSNMTSAVASFIKVIIDALQTIMSDDGISTILSIFTGIAGSLMTIYLFVDLLDKASKDMITLERLVTTLIKWFIAMVILIYLQDIIVLLFKLAMGLYQMLDKSSLNTKQAKSIKFFPNDGNPDPSKWPSYDDVSEAFKKAGYKNSASAVAKKISMFLKSLLPMAIMYIARMAAFFMAASNAVVVVVRTIFAPLGVVQMFDEGQRSSGVRYLKKYFADVLTLAVILGVLFAAGKLQGSLMANVLDKDPFNGVLSVDNMSSAFNLSNCASLVVVQLASVGAMFKANQIANDIVGV